MEAGLTKESRRGSLLGVVFYDFGGGAYILLKISNRLQDGGGTYQGGRRDLPRCPEEYHSWVLSIMTLEEGLIFSLKDIQ